MDTTCLLVVPESFQVLPTMGVRPTEKDYERVLRCVSALLEEALITHADRLLGWQQPSASDRQWAAPSRLESTFSVTLFLGADQSIIRNGVEVEISCGECVVAKATVVLVFVADPLPSSGRSSDHRSVN